MRVETERSRNTYRRTYSDRDYNDRSKRRHYRNDNHPYYPLKSRHYNDRSSPSDRISNYQPSSYSNSRSDFQTNHRDIYPSASIDQSDHTSGLPPPPPTDPYYSSAPTTYDRNISSHYNDSERNRYSQPSYRRESSSPPRSSLSSYQSPIPLSTRSSYNDTYRPNDYQNRSERYDLSQNRNCSIRSPIYRSDSYQTLSSYVNHDQYLPTRDYEMTSSNDRSYQYRDYSRSKRSTRR